MELQHFSHSHPLIFNEDQKDEGDVEGVICSGCEEPISGPRYRCNTTACHFFLHKKCAELPLEIKHHRLHAQHPLLLQTKPQSKSCHFCLKICKNFSYRCDSCFFMLDVKCAFPPCFSEVKISEGQHQFVRLRKPIPLERHSFTCNFCGDKGDDSPLLCTLCLLMVHSYCIPSPATIYIRQHPHLLIYTYFVEEDESGKPHCGVCQIQFNTGHGGYNCKECNFYSHVTCAKEFTTLDSEIKTRNQLPPVADVEHFSHEHKLILIEEDGNDAKCAGCMLPCMLPRLLQCMLPIPAPYYGCSPCNFFLHEACIKREKNFIGRPLVSSETIDAIFRCHLCHQYCNGFADKTLFGEQIFDLRCSKKLSLGATQHDSHQHPLFLTDKRGHPCNGCGSDSGFCFRCVGCDFNLDFRCAGLPPEARHRYDEHPLLLTYSDPNDYQFFCDICEKERDPKLWFYRCQECKFDAHIECVLREYHPYVKLGNTQMYDFHPHPLAIVEKIGDYIEDYPECHNCGERCDELALECSDPQCNFITHGAFQCFGDEDKVVLTSINQ